MKKDNDLVTLAAIVILVPVVIGIGISVINLGIMGINGIKQARFNKKMEKGIKDGSIVVIDGQYYEVQKGETVEEA